jgi:NAD(P)-dependent dehydrogenase (short-subunit alcohol dehydrogenase family)
MDLGLAEETALVTASTSGLGLASATALAGEGANVAICGRDEERLDAARETVAAAGPGAVLAVRADITDPDTVTALVAETVERFGGLDHLVTSAGGPPSGPFLDTDDADWEAAYDLLVLSAVRTLREAHSRLEASDAGTWTAITSTSVREPIEGLVLSNAVRRGVVGLVKTVAREFAPEIRANAVLPGPHETPPDRGARRGERRARRVRQLRGGPQRLGERRSVGAGRRAPRAGRDRRLPVERPGEFRHRDGAACRRRPDAELTPDDRPVGETRVGRDVASELTFLAELGDDLAHALGLLHRHHEHAVVVGRDGESLDTNE